MRVLLGVLLILGGIVLGLYVGIWLMFVGGIIAIVNALQADPVNASGVAWGVVRIVFASAAGGLAFWISVILGAGMIGWGLSKKNK